MKNKILSTGPMRMFLRGILMVAAAFWLTLSPSGMTVSHAESGVEATAEAVPGAEAPAEEDGGFSFLIALFGGIILLVLFVVAVTVATATSTAGIVGDEDEA